MKKSFGAFVLFALLTPVMAAAGPLMPGFGTAPAGWSVDRYKPHTFANVGTYQGRADVLGIETTSAEALANRPAGYQSMFYNTHGMQYAVNGAAGDFLAADLFIPADWRDGAKGNVRTDMWGVMSNVSAVTAYPIIGFTNYGGAGRYRVYDDAAAGGWIDLVTPVNYGGWTSFAIGFNGAAFVYTIDGNMVYTDSTINGTTGFKAAIMQVYNFGDPAFPNAVVKDYMAHWSNAQAVPEPGTLLLFGTAFVAAVTAARRRKK